MKIKVTYEHIAKGQPKSGSKCPIACAITEATGKYVSVGFGGAWIHDRHVAIPAIAEYFIKTFDEDPSTATPFEFEFDYPEPVKLSDAVHHRTIFAAAGEHKSELVDTLS